MLEHWRRERIFQRTLERTADGAEFVFYEGPPTANNVPHVGHVVTRVVKDLFPRFRTMRGYHVARKARLGHPRLAVEIEVEKRLGFSGKQQIEDYGIAEFNRRCLESVAHLRAAVARDDRARRLLDRPRRRLLHLHQRVHRVGLVGARRAVRSAACSSQGYKIQPYCARCGTTLSSHEVAQNYKEADDPSIWVLFPLRAGPERARPSTARVVRSAPASSWWPGPRRRGRCSPTSASRSIPS